VNFLFQHRDARKYIWYRDSLRQRLLIECCIASADLFRALLDVRVNGCKGVYWPPPRSLQLAPWKASRAKQTCKIRKSYRIKWEGPADKDVRKKIANRVSFLYRELPEMQSRRGGGVAAVASSATRACGWKRRWRIH